MIENCWLQRTSGDGVERAAAEANVQKHDGKYGIHECWQLQERAVTESNISALTWYRAAGEREAVPRCAAVLYSLTQSQLAYTNVSVSSLPRLD